MLAAMPLIRICPACEEYLSKASNAMRHHAEDMNAAISSLQTRLTDEEIDQHKIRLIASFNEAQSMWDAYRAHLKEHGIFPVIPTSQP
jgi:hypothetical protein